MVPQFGTAAVRERPILGDGGEIARYLKWEYGDGTGPGFLTGWAAERGPSQHARRLGFIDRLGGLSAAIKARVAAKLMDGWGRERTLLAQWKRGELGTLELVNRLEELGRNTKISGPSLSQ